MLALACGSGRFSLGAMDVNRLLRARLLAAGTLLENGRGSSSHEALSRTQAFAFIEQVRREKARKALSVVEASELSVRVAELSWFGDHADFVQQALAPNERTPWKRRPAQNYETILYYTPKKMWTLYRDADVNASVKEELTLRLASCLGLRNFTEPCLKFLNSFLMTVSMSEVELRSTSTEQRRVLYKRLKKTFKRMV